MSGLGQLIADRVYSLPQLQSPFQGEQNWEGRRRTASVNPYPFVISNVPPVLATKLLATVGGRYAAPHQIPVMDLRCSLVTFGEFASWCITTGTAGNAVT